MKFNFKQETKTAKLPTKHTINSAGIDFYSDEEVYIPKGESKSISTGISWNPEPLYAMYHSKNTMRVHGCTIALIIQSRSGWAFKEGIEASNAGVIDADYISTKEKKAIIHVKLYNNSDKNKLIKVGDKICQGVPQLIPRCDDIEILDNSRNAEGFGSSDKKEIK